MPSAVIDKVNQIGFSEGQTSLLTFYYHKGNPVGVDDDNIAGVYEETDGP